MVLEAARSILAFIETETETMWMPNNRFHSTRDAKTWDCGFCAVTRPFEIHLDQNHFNPINFNQRKIEKICSRLHVFRICHRSLDERVLRESYRTSMCRHVELLLKEQLSRANSKNGPTISANLGFQALGQNKNEHSDIREGIGAIDESTSLLFPR